MMRGLKETAKVTKKQRDRKKEERRDCSFKKKQIKKWERFLRGLTLIESG